MNAEQAKIAYELWVNKVGKWPRFDVRTLMIMFGVELKERRKKKQTKRTKKVVDSTVSILSSKEKRKGKKQAQSTREVVDGIASVPSSVGGRRRFT